MPIYEMKLIDKKESTNEEEVLNIIKEEAEVTYKLYAVNLEGETKAVVKNIEEASEVVNQVKEEYKETLDEQQDISLQVVEKYTENKEEAETVQIAKNNLENEINVIIEKNKMPTVNGIKLLSNPLDSYTYISSRYGSYSTRRVAAHTGTDLACPTGTNIKSVASGTVVFAAYKGSYGNLVKVSHGNNVETWYAHCSSIDCEVGDTVEAGEQIAKVGTTGNSSGPHLHFEIRVNGKALNPQDYLYKNS